MAMTDRKTTHVVMRGNTHDAKAGDVVAVTPEDAERLIAGGHAREPRRGEIKAAAPKAG